MEKLWFDLTSQSTIFLSCTLPLGNHILLKNLRNTKQDVLSILYEPQHKKSGLRDFQPRLTQTGL